ncbi:LysR family transcriptional regulator [Glutamicibacter sp. X7]
MLELRRLRLLQELSVRGTISEVADVLSYSPSSVSQQLSLLEAEAGVPLLRRAGRTLQLTPQAQVLVAHTEQLLDSMERAESDLAATLSSVAGTVRLAAFQTAMLAIMPPVLTQLAIDHPNLRVEMTHHEPAKAMRETSARNFDLVIAEQYPAHAAPHFENLDRRTLTHDPLRLALPPQASAAKITSLAQASGMHWVMEPRGTSSRHFAEEACRTAGFEPEVRYETADLQAHVQLVESGLAAAFLPDLLTAHRPEAVGRRPARLVDLPGAPVRTIFTAMRHSSERSPAIQAVREEIHNQVTKW